MLQGDNIDTEVLQFSTFGKDVIRRLNLHPDTFVQIALQYAYYRLYRKYVLLWHWLLHIIHMMLTVLECCVFHVIRASFAKPHIGLETGGSGE